MSHSRRSSSPRRERGREARRDLRSHSPGSRTVDNQDDKDKEGSGDEEQGREKRARGRGKGEKGKRERFKITLPLINNTEHYNADACTLAKVKKKVLTTTPS